MNIDSLRYFVAVAKHRNITKAAEELYITQSALSKNLQRLEKELNVELFERTKTSIHLTEIGEYCLKEVQQLLCHADNVLAAVKGYSNGEYGTLVIGHTGGENIGLYALIDKMSKTYPQVEIKLHKASPPELLRCVLNFQVDLFFVYSIQLYEAFNDFSFITLENSQLQVIVPKNHRLAKQDKVSLYTLKDENFIVWAQELYPGYNNYFRKICEEYGFTPKIAKEISDKEDQLFSILSGKGIGIRSGLDDGYINPDTFSLITIEMDENKFNDAFLLALGWNKNNKNPCIPPALTIVKEAMCVASME